MIWELWNTFLLGTVPPGQAEVLLNDLRDIRDTAELFRDQAVLIFPHSPDAARL